MGETPYRLWNLATSSLLQRDSNNIISCNGSLKDMGYNSKFTIADNLDLYGGMKIASVFAWSFACNFFVIFSHNLLIALLFFLKKYPRDIRAICFQIKDGVGLARVYTAKHFFNTIFILHLYNLRGVLTTRKSNLYGEHVRYGNPYLQYLPH